MDDVELLKESVIKLEEIKQEPEDTDQEPTWNSTEFITPDTVKSDDIEDDDDEEEIEPPVAVFLDEDIKKEEEWGEEEEEEEPLSGGENFHDGFKDKEGNPESLEGDCITSDHSGENSLESTSGQSVNATTQNTPDEGTTTDVSEEKSVAGAEKPEVDADMQDGSGEEEAAPAATAPQKRPEPPFTVRLFECPVCHKFFTQGGHLSSHMRVHPEALPDTGKGFRCNLCSKQFTQRQALAEHIRAHSKERPYACDVCNKNFTRKEHLIRHQRVHTGERPHACSVCGRAFIQKDGLVKHLRIHSGERPHVCPVCAKDFAQRSSLVAHLKLHDGETPHSCAVCHAAFADTGPLEAHMRAHSEEQPYACERCPERFAAREQLERHHADAHSAAAAVLRPEYECSICGKAFRRDKFPRHVFCVHPHDSPCRCPVCGGDFTVNELIDHLRTHRRNRAAPLFQQAGARKEAA